MMNEKRTLMCRLCGRESMHQNIVRNRWYCLRCLRLGLVWWRRHKPTPPKIYKV